MRNRLPENRRRLLYGPRVNCGLVSSTVFVNSQDHLLAEDGCASASFLSRQLIRITISNVLDSPMNLPPDGNRFFFFLSGGKSCELLTERRKYLSDDLAPGRERCYNFYLSLAEASRIKEETLEKIVCMIGGITFCLLRTRPT